MRDLGILVWVVFLIVGVVGSMVSSARRQMAAGAEAKPTPLPPQWKPAQRPPQATIVRSNVILSGVEGPVPQPRAAPLRPAPRAPAPAPPREPSTPHEARRARARPIFGTGPELVRAVIAAEVLGKPRGLNDEYR
jgi:hypothetical protein